MYWPLRGGGGGGAGGGGGRRGFLKLNPVPLNICQNKMVTREGR